MGGRNGPIKRQIAVRPDAADHVPDPVQAGQQKRRSRSLPEPDGDRTQRVGLDSQGLWQRGPDPGREDLLVARRRWDGEKIPGQGLEIRRPRRRGQADERRGPGRYLGLPRSHGGLLHFPSIPAPDLIAQPRAAVKPPPVPFGEEFGYDEGRRGRVDKTKWLRVGIGVVVLFVVGVFLKLARPVLVPFALALLVSFAVSPALDFLARRKMPRTLALVLTLLLSFAVLYLIGMVFYSGGKSLAGELPSYTEMVRVFLAKIDTLIPDPRLKVGLTDWIQDFNIGQAGSFVLSALGPFFAFMSDLLLVFVFMTFILAGRGRLARKFEEAFPADQASALSRAVVR
ncbi:MAG TPA: AI-2E family transporter, partial [Candidatus Aminicenantes bacterium]|nr:AI-2E family transporter [Candidatus Aminicenantes bacterium]